MTMYIHVHLCLQVLRCIQLQTFGVVIVNEVNYYHFVSLVNITTNIQQLQIHPLNGYLKVPCLKSILMLLTKPLKGTFINKYLQVLFNPSAFFLVFSIVCPQYLLITNISKLQLSIPEILFLQC